MPDPVSANITSQMSIASAVPDVFAVQCRAQRQHRQRLARCAESRQPPRVSKCLIK